MLKKLIGLILAPFKPDLVCRDITQINFQTLHNSGLKYFLIDIDNTLALRKKEFVFKDILYKIREAMKNKWIEDICLVSNVCIPNKKREDRNKKIAQILRTQNFVTAYLPYIKPHPIPFLKALQLMLGAKPSNTAMIGDQIFSDIEGANKLGLFTILVKPLGKDGIFTWHKRLMEVLIKKYFGIKF